MSKDKNVIWTDEAFKEYFGMSKEQIVEIVSQENDDIQCELAKIEGVCEIFDKDKKVLPEYVNA